MPLPTISRRAVLQSGLLGFPAIVPARVLGADAPSNQLTIGFIGTGNNGTNWMRRFLGACCKSASLGVECRFWTLSESHRGLLRPSEGGFPSFRGI